MLIHSLIYSLQKYRLGANSFLPSFFLFFNLKKKIIILLSSPSLDLGNNSFVRYCLLDSTCNLFHSVGGAAESPGSSLPQFS